MRYRNVYSLVGLTLSVGMLTTLWGFDINRSRTAARAGLSPAGAEAVQLHFRTELTGFRAAPDLTSTRLVVGWQEVGGIEPQPFRVLIPMGCFVENTSFFVEDYVRCGVRAVFGRTELQITDFAARMRRTAAGNFVFDMEAMIAVPPSPCLGALGGAGVRVDHRRGVRALPAEKH